MKRGYKLWKVSIGTLVVSGVLQGTSPLPRDWRYEQRFSIADAGLVKLSLPVETIDAAQPGLEDLRLYDDAGNEIPFMIESPTRKGRTQQAPESFQVSLNRGATVVTLRTGLEQPLGAFVVDTPATSFIKAVRVEGSEDGQTWQRLTEGQPIFRREGLSQLRVELAAAPWRWLRATVDDQGSAPIPVTGVHLETSDLESIPSLAQPVTIKERKSASGETRLTVNLGAANLSIAEVRIETEDPLFTRTVTLFSQEVAEDSVREQPIGQGLIYRIAAEGQPPSMNLSVPVERQILSRELLVRIRDESSPPLHVTGVRVERRPAYLIFMARQTGSYHLLLGNRSVGAPRYDVQRFSANLKDVAVSPLQISALMDNPDYRAREALSGLDVTGAPLDVSGWKFRKPIRLSNGSAHQVEIDLDVLSHADPAMADLRVVQGEVQTPYLFQRSSTSRDLSPAFTVSNDPKRPKQSRWTVKLPQPRLPLTRLVCITKTPVFQRELWVSEEITDERGNVSHRVLGRGTWTQTPERESREFALPLDVAPTGDALFVETDNGDNPPIELERIEATIPVTRILFKAKPSDSLFLYYGNPKASSPQYDLSLVARELVAAERVDASLGAEERLQKDSWTSSATPGKGGVLFWGILVLVVVVLLVLISRMLPKPAPPE
jgi:Protein of unknown function (DUF3999)